MLNKCLVALVFLGISAVSATASAQNARENPFSRLNTLDPSLTLLHTGDAALLERDLAYLIAPIKSADDLAGYTAALPVNSPLRLLPQKSMERFIANLTFNESGVSGFSYAELERHLSVSEVYRVLALFGLQHAAAQVSGARVESDLDEAIMRTRRTAKCGIGGAVCDHLDGYECEKRATCKATVKSLCMSTC